MTSLKCCNVCVLVAWVLAVGGVSLRAGEKQQRGGTDRKASDKKARLTPEECERLVEQLVNPGKPPFTEDYVLEPPKNLDEKALEKIRAAYGKLSANIEVALPILVKHVNDARFSYVYEDVGTSGAFVKADVGFACRRIIRAHVEVYSRHVTIYYVEGRSRCRSFIYDECGGIDKWWKRRQNNTLAELQLEGIEWNLRLKKPQYFKSERDWVRAKESLEKMAKEIRDSKKPIKVKHEVHFFGK
jgi:hypothetical protein